MTEAPTLRPALAASIAEHLDTEEQTAPGVQLEPLPDGRFLDRELSWLAFNQRVLELAEDPTVPLLERVRFLAIFASNLDEFFMVRVAGLKRRIATGIAVTAASGTTKATTRWPKRASSAPTTATSRTDGCRASTSSTSVGCTFSPPLRIMSSIRPTSHRSPSSSRWPRSPGKYHPSRSARASASGRCQ